MSSAGDPPADTRGARRATPAPGGDRDAAFTALRPHLERVAYATLGSRAEAENVVQEAWLRLEGTAPGEVRHLRAWATTVVGRLALDVLGSARRRREAYVGSRLPEPVVTLHPAAGAEDPADRVTLDETVSFALMRMLETLSPAERTAFVLHDVFGLTHERRGIPVHGALVKVNGEAGRLLQAGSERSVLAFSIAAGRIVALDVQRNPAKLERTPWLG